MASGYSDLSEIRKNDAYARYHRPAKINLINERPRRESLVEQQLSTNLSRPDFLLDVQQPNPSWFEAPSQTSMPTEVTSTSRGYQSSQQTSSMFAPADRTTRGLGYGPSPGETTTRQNQFAELENDLAQREARLKREIAHLNQQLSPWARPRQIREPRREPEPRSSRSQQRWVKECPSSSSSPRPNSRASSTRSNTEADLMDKAAKLVQTAEELEKKPLKTQMILIENGARRQMESSPTRAATTTTNSSGSIHTAVIKVPNHEVDNKSPLPVAFDNFSTLGVRGNLASIGAAPPDTPYAPIFPVVKRTPSPMDYRGSRY